MRTFECDYTEGAHPKILAALSETNMVQMSGYGFDPYTARAAEKIKAACEAPDATVTFLVGGTQTNMIVLDLLLEAYEGVIAPKTGHINVHEAGAIEFTGHKVLAIKEHDGVLDVDALEAYLKTFYADATHEHMVRPGAVYLTHPTEYGTLYTRSQIERVRALCDRYEMKLYVDGARLGYALGCPENDLTLSDLARLCDAFSIGGTKLGLLCGEAVVFPREAPKMLLTQVKRHGGLLAKGRVLGVQFDAMFTDGLYEEIGREAIRHAKRIRKILLEKGYPLAWESPTNQQFILLSDAEAEKLRACVGFDFWGRADEHHWIARFTASWSTTDADVTELETALPEKAALNR
ncbi:MAG: aminotransferase class I/II-fold pyridoxal phosphate-dependent enzyme [Clostridia bacterium]|nr:aminotransferase class I/II-fold pyridoxal phosphate-dependent enzyme [Clostridia bacterium]